MSARDPRPVRVAMLDVTVAYDGAAPVLTDVSIEVGSGQFIGIVGPSGSGKSTLLRTLLGVQKPASGRVVRAPGTTIGFVPQVERIDWNFPVTVTECVVMARSRGWRTPWVTRSERAEAESILERLGLAGLGRRHIRDLSGGQQQRVFLARALFTGSDVIFLDEPTAGLDVKTRHEVLHVLGELHREGVTILLTTHDLNGIAAHLPHIVCLNNSVVAQGPPSEVLMPAVLEQTYGSPMQVLEHAGLRVVVDAHHEPTLDGAALVDLVAEETVA